MVSSGQYASRTNLLAFNIKCGCEVKGCKRVHDCRVKVCQGKRPAFQRGAQGGA